MKMSRLKYAISPFIMLQQMPIYTKGSLSGKMAQSITLIFGSNNIIIQQTMQHQEPIFEMVKLTAEEVIMRHHKTKQLYTVMQGSNNKYEDIEHDDLEQGWVVQKQLLFPLPMSTLGKHSKQMKKSQQMPFQEQQIVNTFMPILHALHHLHERQIAYGAINPHTIIFNHEGETKLLYPPPRPTSDLTALGDLEDVGKLILSFSIPHKPELTTAQQLNLLSQTQSFTGEFMLGVFVMVKRIDLGISTIKKLFTENGYLHQNIGLKKMYEAEFKGKEKVKDVVIKPKRPKEQLQNFKNYQPFLSPRNLGINNRRTLKGQENVENKKYHEDCHQKLYEEYRKREKKNIDSVLKKMSNRKGGEGEHPSPTYRKILRDIRETKQKEDLLKIGVIGQRMGTVEKKMGS